MEESIEADCTGMVTHKSFSILQSRKFRLPGTKDAVATDDADLVDDIKRNTLGRFAKLCPSMDLILVRSVSPSSSLVIYRSLSWEKIADITLPETLGDTTTTPEGIGGTSGIGSSDNNPESYCWSPNGQCVAVAQGSNIFLYGVESLVTASGASAGGRTTSGSSNATWTIDLLEEEKQQEASISINNASIDVLSLHWVHVGKLHPTAAVPSIAEEEQEVSWGYRCHYIDQSTKFLPPSAYYSNDESADGRGGASDDPEASSLAHSSLPECKTPLSVLCVSTNDLNHKLYLHGRYPLLSLPRSKNSIAESIATSSSPRASSIKTTPMVVASNDLAFWLTTTPFTKATSVNSSDLSATTGSSNFLTLYRTPFLKRDRYSLQQIATLHTSITAHIQTIKRSVSIVADSWKTSLRPLDQKIMPLTNLLRNYGVEVGVETNENSGNTPMALSTVMKKYIMMGHVNHSSSIANAMDQFFTGVQMNDQLIQRMERTLSASMANVESTAIRCLLRPTQAFAWQVQELSGLIQYHYNIPDEDDEYNEEEDKSLLVEELNEATGDLWISVENAMTAIVTGRMVVRDFCGWLRHAGSQVKARGTAPKSVQRENAKKRRVTQAVLERLVTVLNKSGQREGSNRKDDEMLQIGLCENLLNLKVTKLLKTTTENVSDHPESPSSVKGILYPIPNVCPSLRRTINTTRALFSNPLSNIPDKIKSTDIFLPRVPKNEECRIATHSRVGRDPESIEFWDDDDEEEEEEDHNYFLPNIDNNSNHYANLSPISELQNCRQWFLIAQAHGTTIQLFCLPVGWRQKNEYIDYDEYDIEDESREINDIPFYLTSKLALPAGGKVVKIGFYGDDGKSSLSSGIDSGTGMEGKQNIGFIYEKNSPSHTTELWTTAYDSLLWQAVPFDPMLLNFSQVDANCCKEVLPIALEESRDEKDGIIFACCRTISEGSPANFCELLLCGSRGVGGVAIMSDGGVISMDLLDLEDDEEEEDEEEDESY